MKFEAPHMGNEKENEKEKGGEGKLFEVRRKVMGIEFVVSLDNDGEPITGSVDLEKNKAEIHITPDGVWRGIKALNNFVNNSGIKEKVSGWLNSIEEGRDDETIKKYAEQEGVNEREVIEEFLDELAESSRPEKE